MKFVILLSCAISALLYVATLFGVVLSWWAILLPVAWIIAYIVIFVFGYIFGLGDALAKDHWRKSRERGIE